MAEVRDIPWKRLATESVVIVVSILFAFAIDAWWEDRQDQKTQAARLARVAAEIEVNRSFIKEKIETIDSSIVATSEYLSWMGPEPRQITLDEFAEQWVGMIDIGMFSLVHRAVDEYIGAGDAISAKQTEIRDMLLAWYSEGDRIERQYDLLREEHGKVNDHHNVMIPSLHTASTMTIMQDHPKSKFPFDPATALSDQTAESLLTNYLIRMEFVSRRMKGYQEDQVTLLEAISESAGTN